MTAGRSTVATQVHWNTPAHYLVGIREVFGGVIHLDPCSNETSAVASLVEYRPPTDGLRESWDAPTIFVNPPYGRDRIGGTTIKDWLRRCSAAHLAHGSEVIALVPVATNTSHWKEFVFPTAAAVCFLSDPRVKFTLGGVAIPRGAPMACALVYWGHAPALCRRHLSALGAVVRL